MGTLQNQPPRPYMSVNVSAMSSTSGGVTFMAEELLQMKRVAEQAGCTLDQVLQLRQIREDERRNDLYVANGDIWDEQIAGIGEILSGIADALSEANA